MDQEAHRKFYNTALFRQCILAACISLSYFNIGLVRGYSSTAFPTMKLLRPDLLPSAEIASWAGSIAPFGAVCGSIIAGPLLQYVGRKRTLCVASPVGVAAWTIVALCPDWQWLLVGRVLCGCCVGLCLPTAQIYVTECTDARIRGVIGSFPSMSMSLGILVSYVLGGFIAWQPLAWVGCAVSATLVVAVVFLPESPTWLSGRKCDEQQAQRSRKWLKLERGAGGAYRPSVEMVALKETPAVTEQTNLEDAHSWRVLLSRPILRPFAIGLTLLMIQQFSGIDAVIFFTVDIFRASGSTIDGNVATCIVGALQLGSNIAALFVVDRAGRKPLLIGSAVVMALAMALMGAAFYMNENGVTGYGFLPLLSLTVFMIGFSCGFGSIPFLLMGEIFPAAQRALLSSLSGSFNLAAMFTVIKTYHPLEAAITTAGTFWMYSVLCTLGAVFVVVFVPETKGRDSEEIAQLFRRSGPLQQSGRTELLSAHRNGAGLVQ